MTQAAQATSSPPKTLFFEHSGDAMRVVVRRKLGYWFSLVLFGACLVLLVFCCVSALAGSSDRPLVDLLTGPTLISLGALLIGGGWFLALAIGILFEDTEEEFRISRGVLMITARLLGKGFGRSFPIARISHLHFGQVSRRTRSGKRVVRLIMFNSGSKQMKSRRGLTLAEGEAVYRFLAQHLPPGAFALHSGFEAP